MIFLHEEAERSGITSAPFVWKVVCQKYVICCPKRQTLLDEEAIGASMWKMLCIP
jgi:hypothetical protein